MQDGFSASSSFIPGTKVSVVVPARNEEKNIAACIESVLNQNYPEELLEVIVINDHSSDNTEEIIKSFDGRVKCINLSDYVKNDERVTAYKKRALSEGIRQSVGELIITTDADCTSNNLWIKTVVAKYESTNAVMVVAPVQFTSNNALVQDFQLLDFMSMQGVTAATLQLKLGNMCNGANLAFKREAFDAVDGYNNIDHIASGDDYLLMMKLGNEYPGQITYLKSAQAIVKTAPQPSWKAFYQQRVRWASKSGKYDDKSLTIILLIVYLTNVSFLGLVAASIYDVRNVVYLIAALVLKTIVELHYLLPVAKFFSVSKKLFIFPIMQSLHILYIIIAGFLGSIGKYEWKGRSVK